MTRAATPGGLDDWRQGLCETAPRAAALSCGDESLTRAGLDALIQAEQRRLVAAGLRGGQVLAWLGLNSPRMLAALFACERLGAVFLPLNWRLAQKELLAVLLHAGARRVDGSADFAPLAQALNEALAARPGEAVNALASDEEGLRPGDLMLVYTSGTTGQPKGALHTAAQMRANAEAAIAVQGLGADTRTLAVLPLFHVGGLCIQTLPTLLAGGAVRLQPRFDPGAWFDDLVHWRPTTSLLVPATMRALIEHPRWPQADLSPLRFINSGSSVVPLGLIEAFHARGVPVAQVYGSTETGPVSIALPPEQALAHAGSVGWPAPGVAIRLVDGQGTNVPAGEVGEILVRGPNVMRAYLHEPADAALQAGWFRTGDLGRFAVDEGGVCQVVGRCKDMIVSGGENIYPAEIENLVEGLAGVAECAVVGLPDLRWGEVPVLAVVQRRGEAAWSRTALQALFDGRLARYKQPRRVVEVQALPRTALGKVRKADLAALLSALPSARQELSPRG